MEDRAMSESYRFKCEDALPRAQALLEQLRPVCEQVEIAGSLRRGRAAVGDIEIVALPKFEEHAIAGQMDMFGGGTEVTTDRISQLDGALDRLIATGDLYRDRPYTHQKGQWGEKMKTFWVSLTTGEGIEYIQVDLFIVTPPAQWGPIFTIRTGPRDFGQALMRYINSRTLLKQDDGYLQLRGTGEVVETPDEASYFAALGLAWIAPADRCAAALKRAVKRNGAAKVGQQEAQAVRRCVDDAVVRAMIRGRLKEAAGLIVE
jgi:DNA polymerase/3'-5' exonuclease PolX